MAVGRNDLRWSSFLHRGRLSVVLKELPRASTVCSRGWEGLLLKDDSNPFFISQFHRSKKQNKQKKPHFFTIQYSLLWEENLFRKRNTFVLHLNFEVNIQAA